MRCRLVLTYILFILCDKIVSQDYSALRSNNSGGVTTLLNNPASAEAGTLKADFSAAGFELTFNNSWLAVKSRAFGFPKLPDSWKNITPDVPDNIYKNFIPAGDRAPHRMELEQRILLPSFWWRFDKQQSFGFICSFRQFSNISGISAHLAKLFENEFNLSLLQNNPFYLTDLRAVKMSWLEYGFNYARSVRINKAHTIQAGLTFKLVQGLESGYFIGRDLQYLFSTVDTNSFMSADFSYALSQSASKGIDLSGDFVKKIPHAAMVQPALDFGLVYKFGPADDGSAYKMKFEFAVTDLGRIRFSKQHDYYDVDAKITQQDVIRYAGAGSAKRVDSLIHADYPANKGSEQFTIILPAAISISADYNFNNKFFVGMNAHVGNINKRNPYRVYNVSTLVIAPRYEKQLLAITVPLSVNSISLQRGEYIMPGLILSYGPLSAGTADWLQMMRKNISYVNFFIQLKYSVPYKNLKRKWKT